MLATFWLSGDPKASRVLLNQPGEERQDVLENDPRLGVAARHHYHFATTLPKRTNQRRNREARANCGFSATSRHGDRGRPVADDAANQSTLPRQDRKPLPDPRALRSEAVPEAGLHRSLNRSWVLKPKSVWRRDYATDWRRSRRPAPKRSTAAPAAPTSCSTSSPGSASRHRRQPSRRLRACNSVTSRLPIASAMTALREAGHGAS